MSVYWGTTERGEFSNVMQYRRHLQISLTKWDIHQSYVRSNSLLEKLENIVEKKWNSKCSLPEGMSRHLEFPHEFWDTITAAAVHGVVPCYQG